MINDSPNLSVDFQVKKFFLTYFNKPPSEQDKHLIISKFSNVIF